MSDFTPGMRRALNAFHGAIQDGMPTFDVDCKRINAFELEDFYVFKHYFQGGEVFDELRNYYKGEEYRFEVPKDALEEVETLLFDHFFELTVVEDIEEFCVVKRRYTDHPTLFFRNAVTVRSRGEYTVFLMKDELSVEQAVIHGAKPLSSTSLSTDF